MIAPQIKMAHTIRSLLSVAETLRGGLQHRDPETDEILIDIKNTELYLKVSFCWLVGWLFFNLIVE
jgi:hypothetical protein